MKRSLQCLTACFLLGAAPVAHAADSKAAAAAEQVTKLTRGTTWKQVEAVPINFLTHHPQGMVKIGDTLFVSSVEIKEPTEALSAAGRRLRPRHGRGRRASVQDRSEGQPRRRTHPRRRVDLSSGRHRLRRQVHLGPGRRVPAQQPRDHLSGRSGDHEGRPRCSASRTMSAAIVHNTDDNSLHGVSWGSRRFYRWTLGRGWQADQCGDAAGEAAHAQHLALSRLPGLQIRRQQPDAVHRRDGDAGQTPEAPPFRLGGVDLVDLADGRPIFQAPVLLWTPSGMDMTHNPVWIEPSDAGLRGYFMPEDDKSTLYIYDARHEVGACRPTTFRGYASRPRNDIGVTPSSRTVRGRSACGGSRWCRRRSRRAWRRAAGGRSGSR